MIFFLSWSAFCQLVSSSSKNKEIECRKKGKCRLHRILAIENTAANFSCWRAGVPPSLWPLIGIYPVPFLFVAFYEYRKTTCERFFEEISCFLQRAFCLSSLLISREHARRSEKAWAVTQMDNGEVIPRVGKDQLKGRLIETFKGHGLDFRRGRVLRLEKH
jgi:hypothetical protein